MLKPTILFIHDRFNTPGGAEEAIFSYANAMGQEYHLSLITTNSGKAHAYFDDVYKLDPKGSGEELIEKFHPSAIFLHNWHHLPLLRSVVKSHAKKIAMIHNHASYCMRGSKTFPWSGEPCKRKAGPFCLFPCSGFLMPNRYSEIKEEIELLSCFDRILVGSTYMNEELIRQEIPGGKIQIAPPPIHSYPRFEPHYGSSIVAIGELLKGKGFDYFLTALAKVGVPFRATIIGEGPEKGRLIQQAKRLGIADKLSFPGYLHHQEMLPYLKTACTVVMPSMWPEPFGIVGVEAMWQGLPVIGFNSGGISDWLKDGRNGFLVERGDTDTLASRMTTFLQEPELAKEMGEEAREWVEKNFPPKKMHEGLKVMINDLISGRV